MVTGETHIIQVVDQNGQPVTGLAWTSSDPAIVSLSSTDPPVLTALAAGSVTITAGDATADITVFAGALPIGTVIWSNPGNGSGVYSVVPAVPTDNSVADVFALQNNGTVQAVTSDGTTAWTADISQADYVAEDFQGGLVLANWGMPGSIWSLDAATGQPRPAYQPDSTAYLSEPQHVAVHPDGTIFAIEQDSNLGAALVGVDPATGAQKFVVPLNPDNPADGGIESNLPSAYGLIIAGDGNCYVSYSYSVDSADYTTTTSHLMLLKVNSSGTYQRIDVKDFAADWPTVASFTTSMITNADQGMLLTWEADQAAIAMIAHGQRAGTEPPPPAPNAVRRAGPRPEDSWDGSPSFGMATVTGTSVNVMDGAVIPNQMTPVNAGVQAQDGSIIGTVQDWSGNQYMINFDVTADVRWVVPGAYQPQIATDDGGVIANANDGSETAITFDQNGNATGQLTALPAYSWYGNSYQTGIVAQVAAEMVNVADGYWDFDQGNASHNGTSNRPIAPSVRALIAQKALSHVNDQQHWLDTSGHNQCNIFVKDVLREAGTTPPVSPVTPSWGWRMKYLLGVVDTPAYPAQSRDWANPNTILKCWQPVRDDVHFPPDISRPGDVIAEPINYSDAYGHVGIVSGPGQTVSADSAAQCVLGKPNGTIDISDYGFRADNWVDPLNCGRIYGKKKDATVKRFACQ